MWVRKLNFRHILFVYIFFFFEVSQSSATSGTATRAPLGRQSSQTGLGEDTEDTMKNLRKTFAGIFGDM